MDDFGKVRVRRRRGMGLAIQSVVVRRGVLKGSWGRVGAVQDPRSDTLGETVLIRRSQHQGVRG